MRRLFGMLGVILLSVSLMTVGASAYEDADTVGRSNCLLTAVGTSGALSGESALGDAAADAVRRAAGTDIAIVNGGDLCADIPAGSVTYERVRRVFAADRKVFWTTVTPAQLTAILEAGLSHICLDLENGDNIDREASAYEGFPQVSGMTFQYDASALPGSRVTKLSVGGQQLSMNDDQTLFTLAASDCLLAGGYGNPASEDVRDAGFTLSEAFCAYLSETDGGLDEPDKRMKVIGTPENSLISGLPPNRAIGILLLLLVICFGCVKSRLNAKKTD